MENFHRQLKTALRDREQPDSWLEKLPLVLLCMRARQRSAVPRWNWFSRIQCVFPVSSSRSTLRTYYLAQVVLPKGPIQDLVPCSLKLMRWNRLRRHMGCLYDGPFKVEQRGWYVVLGEHFTKHGVHRWLETRHNQHPQLRYSHIASRLHPDHPTAASSRSLKFSPRTVYSSPHYQNRRMNPTPPTQPIRPHPRIVYVSVFYGWLASFSYYGHR